MTETDSDNLKLAIFMAYGADPHLGLPHPETITAIADAVLLMCEVSKRRPAAYAGEPWRTISSFEHTKHASGHAKEAKHGIEENSPLAWIDEDGLPHAAHAMLRLTFALTRYQQEGGK